MTTEIRPTPECDGNLSYGGTLVTADFARKLERERDSAKTLNRTLLDQLEAKDAQIEAMREAIKDAHYALGYVYNGGEGSCAFPFRTDDDLCSENRFHHVKDALDALKPFLND